MGSLDTSQRSPLLFNGISSVDRELISQWNNSQDDLEDCCLHEVVERQAQLTPDNLAISAWDGCLTYGELDRISSQLAAHLVEAGIQHQDFVLFLHEKSRLAPAVVTAILKAGAICVPLDPSNAQKRLSTVLDDTKARFAVTSPTLAHVVQDAGVVSIVAKPDLMVDGLVGPGVESLPPPRRVSPNDAAFLMYSSGSTGKPKGIVQEHGPMCFSIRHHSYAMGIRPHSRTLQFAAFTFDTSMGDIFGTFMQGAILCVCSDWERLNDLAASIRRLEANYACLTPTVAQQLDPVEVPTLKALAIGGEAMTATLVDRWADKADLINVYGITECLVWTFTAGPLKEFSRSIGRPSCGRAWIVDVDDPNKLLPIGAVGELLIEGPNIAREYLNEPEKTAKAFIHPPQWLHDFSPVRLPGNKVYRTGDLARYTGDGAIDFMGRKDTQVKLNGQRVELGEIEYRMKQCLPENTQVAALVIPDSLGSRSILIGVIRNDAETSEEWSLLEGEEGGDTSTPFTRMTEQLRKDMLGLLAELLVPTIYMPVGEMPLTVSGKLDRLQLQQQAKEWLREYQENYTSAQAGGDSPSTEQERMLASVWSDIFGIDASLIGVDHEFVRLGADSALAMRLVSKVRKLGYNLTVAQVFQNQRLGDMAKVVKEHRQSEGASSLISPFDLVTDAVSVRAAVARQCNVTEASVQDAYPCTALQQALLALSMSQPGSYMSRKRFHVPEGVPLATFMAAWAHVYRQFEILRTRIVDSDQGLLQVVVDEEISWEFPKDIDAYLQRDRSRPVSLGTQLNRFAVIHNNGPQELPSILWSAHHCTYDGWSESLVMQEVNQFISGRGATEHAKFNVFVKHLQQNDDQVSASYWNDELSGSEMPSFPVRHDPSRTTQDIQSVKRAVQLRPVESLTASTFVRSALAILNTKYTYTDEAIYGIVMSGRNAEVDGIDTVVGPTFSTMPLRIPVQRQQSVKHFLDQVQSQSIAMIPHETFGLQNIQRLGKQAEVACQFQCLLIIQPSDDTFELGEVKPVWEEATDAEQYPLTIDCRLGAGEVLIEAFFDPSVLDALTVQRMLGQFDEIIQQLLAADSGKLVEDIDPAGLEDLSLIWQWNAEYPRAIDRCVHEVIEEQCLQNPTKQAICSWDGEFTYEELDSISNTLAVHLTELGVGPEILVPVCFERSKWAAVSVLAINKAGAAFVLLNPTQPLDRLRSIVEQTNSPVILSSRECNELCTQLASTVVLVEDYLVMHGAKAKTQVTNGVGSPALPYRSCSHNPDGLMYVVFTSGTTGTPKGIMVENRSFSTYIEALARMTGAKSSWRGLVSSAYSFDSSLEEMLMPLMIGGTTCMPSQHEISNDLTGAMNRMGVHWGVFTPSLSRLVNPRELTTMTDIYIGGEQMTDAIVETYGSCLKLTNTYGPSECCPTGCVSSTPELYGGHIGRGVACRTWVVDPTDHERLMPVGCIGELILDGPNVGRGYLHDEEKTKAAFIDPPSWLSAVETPPVSNGVIHYRRRMYKTGDLVRYCSNGTLEYFGRKDQQIKLYGQRIELSEIEYHIKEHLADYADCVVDVVSRDTTSSQQLLAAFVVFEKGSENLQNGSSCVANDARIAALRQALSTRIPSYMLPALYIECPKIPLTSSDKTDRRALKQMIADLSEEEYLLATGMTLEKRPPKTETEIFLHGLWAETLKISPDHIGLDDEFLRLGGDSIQAMRLAAAARKQGWALTVASITRYPSLEQMALQISHGDNSDLEMPKPFSLLDGTLDLEQLLRSATELCNVDESLIEDIYPCSHLQGGLIALSLKSPGAYIVDDVFAVPDDIESPVLEAACRAVVERNPILRTRIVHTTSGFLQVVLKEDFHWNVASAATASGSATTLGLGEPLCRFELSQDSQSKRFLTWTLHHALYDGWSMSLLQRQLDDFFAGREATPTIPYSHFIRHARSLSLDAVRDFWTNRLAGSSPVHFPKPPSASYLARPDRTAQKTVTFQQQFAPNVGITNFVQAAWAITVSRHTESRDISLGTTVSGRKVDLPGIESVTGPTFATVPAIVRIHEDDTKSTFLQRLQSEALDQIPFEQAGLGVISKFTDETNEACQFQSLFVIQPVESDQDRAHTLLDVSAERADIDTYPMNLECQLTSDGVVMKARFDSSVISDFHVSHLLSQFSHVMLQLCAPEDGLVQDISTLSAEDMDQIKAWNSIPLDPIDKCIHDLILAKCDDTPEAQAICAWDGDFTYREMKVWTECIAGNLQGKGVKRGDVVPIFFDKSKWAVVAMLGVLRAGGVCVCLDPVNHPVARMRTIVESVGAGIIVSDPLHQDTAITLTPAVLVVGQGYEPSLESYVVSQLASESTPDDAAFLIYTSGSTGVPKGMVHTHRSLSSSYHALGQGIKIRSDSRVFQFAAFTFDMVVIDTLATLVHGGALCIPSDEERLNDVEGSFTRLGANEAFLTPSFARQLNPARMTGLRTLRTGGEPVSKKDVELYAKYAQVLTISGPAEVSLCTSGVLSPGGNMPPYVGHMINALSWVAEIEDETRLAPIGVIGELLVEGPTVAREYLHQPELTRKAFIQVPDWLSDDPSSGTRHVYKTGDLVRYNPDGSMDIMGRRDGQVKIRGQRIELQEVEHHVDKVLGAMSPSFQVVETAVDVVRPKDDPEKTYLVAFLAVGSAMEQDTFETAFEELTSEVLQKMESRLPPYMVPSACIPLEKIPASASKKTDRKVLRAIGGEKSTAELLGNNNAETRGVVEPTTPMERLARQLWASTLNLDEKTISVEDTFVRLGGDSIRAIALVSAAREQKVAISVADVFRHPQLRDLAKVMRTQEHSILPREKPALLFKPRDEMVDIDLLARVMKHVPQMVGVECVGLSKCTPVQQGMLDARSSNVEIFQPHMSFAAKSKSRIDVCRLMKAWERTVAQHEILRTALVSLPGDPSWYQYVMGSYQPEIHYISGRARSIYEQQDDLLEQNHLPPHQLLIRRESERELTCTLHMSHALLEGGCIDELFNWVKRFYYDPDTSITVQPPQYYHFEQYLQTRPTEEAMRFWSEYLDNAQPCLLPSESKSEALQDFRSRQLSLPSPSRLRSACVKYGVTLPILIQSAWALTLNRITRNDDVILGYVVSNRETEGLGDVIGTILGILPRRLQISTSEGLSDVIKKCNDDWVDCLPHQHLSYWEYYQRLHNGRSPHQNLFNTAINYRRFGAAREEGDLVLDNVRSRDPFEYNVLLGVDDDDDGEELTAQVDYWASAISDVRIAGLVGFFEGLLEGFVSQ
ncbi:hypothetical protein GGS20DRAFT_284545 [Poronia punctata]|nr:hypothetical protein GGS20DRAFT_284545 [Poronia punctata]